MKKRKKISPFQKFLQVFIKSVLMLAAFLLVAFISYKGTLLFYKEFGGPRDDKAAKLINELYGKVEVTDVPVNLIYAVGENQEIKALVLEIMNTRTNNMDYITIPMKSQFTISNDLYQKLCNSGCDAPQIMKLSKMDNYFSNEVLYEYGVILLEDLLDIDINFYTAVPAELFKKMFKQREAAPAYGPEGEPMQSYYEWKLKETYKKEITGLKGDELEKYIRGKADACQSNLNMRSRLEYAESYEKVNADFIYTHSLYGKLEGGDFEVNVEESNRLIQSILNNPSYTKKQNGSQSAGITRVSLGYDIQILNASQITGLAASYQERLKEDGYTITKIGNYPGEQMEQTKIRIGTEGIGTDLKSYFENAIIEKSDMLTDCDIQIILGTDADTK